MDHNRDRQGEHQTLGEAPQVSTQRMVLVAEDDEPIAEAIILVLEEEGFLPAWVTNGKEALEAAGRRWPDLVLTDRMMPEMGGLELIEALRARAAAESRPMPPVVLMTAVAGSGSGGMAELTKAGVDAVVSKPFNISALIALVSRLIENVSPQ